MVHLSTDFLTILTMMSVLSRICVVISMSTNENLISTKVDQSHIKKSNYLIILK